MYAKSLGVFRAPSQAELDILALADAFRAAYCDIQQERHERTIDLRNESLPTLLPLLAESEAIGFRIYAMEKEIKDLHAAERDRNARTDDQAEHLQRLRDDRAAAYAAIKPLRAQWAITLRAYTRWLASQADWKNVKALSRRRIMYQRLVAPSLEDLRTVWDAAENAPTKTKHGAAKPRAANYVPAPFPDDVDADAIAQYMAMDLDLDLRERELFAEYQARGLHSAIRGEIVAASQPKLTEDGEGMIYRYGRRPEPEAWGKITIAFPGGATIANIVAGKVPGLRAEEVGKHCWNVVQQIGTKGHPLEAAYRLPTYGAMSHDMRIKRWTLHIWRERRAHFSGVGFVDVYKRTAIAVVDEKLDKPHGMDGVVTYRIGWTRKKHGVEVCRFEGTHVHESVVLPNWLLERRMGSSVAQEECDLAANEALQARGALPPANKRQGVDALATYCAAHPTDNEAGNLLDALLFREHCAQRDAKLAIRTIQKIYEMVVKRVCSRHAAICHKLLPLKKMKRYDTRDLLADDKIPLASRKYMHAAAPGKLVALLRGWGLPASDDVVESTSNANTDIFSSEIAAIGRRSQVESESLGG